VQFGIFEKDFFLVPLYEKLFRINPPHLSNKSVWDPGLDTDNL